MVSMAIMVSSFRSSVDAWLGELLPADLYFRAAGVGDSGRLSAADQARIAALPGVQRAEFQREDQIQWRADAPPPLWVSEAMVDVHGVVVGSEIELPLAGRSHRFTVAGVWRDYSRPRGTLVIERSRYVALTGDSSATNGALWLAADATPAAVRERLARELPGGEQLDIGTAGDIRRTSLRIFDRTFAVTYALELAAMVIGLVGLSSSFAALVLARRREFGMLRHIGMTRGEIRAMLATEGALVSGVGLVAGIVLGGGISLILIHVVNRQSFHWGMDLAVPWAALGAFAAIVLALSVFTAVVAGRHATSGDAVRAVRDDW
jgi:putative ABC transport system permease protein